MLTLTPPAKKISPTSILIADDAIGSLGKEIAKLGGFDSTVILFDQGIEPIAQKVSESLRAKKMNAHMIAVKSGDASKSLAEVDRIVAEMLSLGCGRSTLVIAVGGGMITDLGGFVASIFMRGVPSVLVPTTMLAMVDAAIGGKTAVNCADHKNMIGTILHPRIVAIDTALLQAIPEAQLAEGLVEAVKIAAIVDLPYFEWLEKNLSAVLERKPKAIAECIEKAVVAKVRTVESDEGDWTERLYLNFGHTVGHAVEALSQFRISHGQAVAIGIAAELTMTGFKDAKRVTTLLEALKMPLTIPKDQKAEDLWKLMLNDKKSVAGTVRIAVPSVLGTGSLQTLERGAFDALFR